MTDPEKRDRLEIIHDLVECRKLLFDARADVANLRSGMAEANKRWTDALRELERVQTRLNKALGALREIRDHPLTTGPAWNIANRAIPEESSPDARAIATQEAG